MIAAYEPPTCNKVMSLNFCAQMVGTPIMTPEPTTTPAVAAALVRNVRRVTMGVRSPDVPSAIVVSLGAHVFVHPLPVAHPERHEAGVLYMSGWLPCMHRQEDDLPANHTCPVTLLARMAFSRKVRERHSRSRARGWVSLSHCPTGRWGWHGTPVQLASGPFRWEVVTHGPGAWTSFGRHKGKETEASCDTWTGRCRQSALVSPWVESVARWKSSAPRHGER